MEKIIIGMVGSFGSGCTYIAKTFLTQEGYEYISLSDILREQYYYDNTEEKGKVIIRSELQNYGNNIREKNGSNYLAALVKERIEKSHNTKFVIDSIRNPEEIYLLKNTYVSCFIFGVYAEVDVRWERIKTNYLDDRRVFEADEKRDQGEKVEYGQRVTDCFRLSDVVISNNTRAIKGNSAYTLLDGKVKQYLTYFLDDTTDKIPTENEANMAMAYANSLRSSCLKRKVGAVIVDKYGNAFSAGYNEVPRNESPCLSEYAECYRNYQKREIGEIFDEESKGLKDKVLSKIKILDQCRALHAEENALLNVTRFGSSSVLGDSTLYTTTYPCNLCANKIAQVNIKRVVYFEPYPVLAAKKTLQEAGIEQEMFEGITYNSFFKVFNKILE